MLSTFKKQLIQNCAPRKGTRIVSTLSAIKSVQKNSFCFYMLKAKKNILHCHMITGKHKNMLKCIHNGYLKELPVFICLFLFFFFPLTSYWKGGASCQSSCLLVLHTACSKINRSGSKQSKQAMETQNWNS